MAAADVVLRDQLIAQLRAESTDLFERVRGLTEAELLLPTPAVGWTVVDSIIHLAATDADALRALDAPDAFVAQLPAVHAAGDDYVESAVRQKRRQPPRDVVRDWAEGHERLADRLATVEPRLRIPWFGPPMGLASFISARLMETWAHGQDIVDALGQVRQPTPRLRVVADIGVRARRFAFTLHGLALPDGEVRVELTSPDGDVWEWGSPYAVDRITGSAFDFCLLVTRRRHPADLSLVVSGSGAELWVDIAQAYAGAPGAGRQPGAPKASPTDEDR